MANYLVFVGFSLSLGGTAFAGKTMKDEFVVKGPEGEVAVSKKLYWLNYIQSLSLWLTQPLGAFATFFLIVVGYDSYLYKRRKSDYMELQKDCLFIDKVLWKGICRGKFGVHKHRVWWIQVKLFEDGLWLKPLFLPPLIIPKRNIQKINPLPGKYWGRLRIDQTTGVIPAPTILAGKDVNNLTLHLQKLLGSPD